MGEKIVYHYCSLDAFLNIIDTGIIRLSDVNKSNDYMECILCKEKVYGLVESVVSGMDDHIKERWSNELKVKSFVKSYCVCFSGARDSLQMWLGYGDKAQGIAIGFDKEILDTFSQLSLFQTKAGYVIYDENKQKDYIHEIVDDILSKLTKSSNPTGIEIDIGYLLKYPFIKNDSFAGEREYRLVLNSGFSTGGMTEGKIGGFRIKGEKYRASNTDVISYYDLDFSDIKQTLIREIIIGGKSKVTPLDIYGILYRYGYYNNINNPTESSPINICKSKCTYQ